MKIGGMNGNTNMGAGGVGMGNPGREDSYSKNLKKQIEDAQKELQELAGDKEMDPDIKMKKRQEIQKQISNLNMQLRQHQMEERRKAQQEKQQNQQNIQEKNQAEKAEENAAGLSQNSMQAMLSAEGSMKQAKIHGSTAKQMENESDIKRTEIKLEGGGSTRTANDNAVVSKKWDEVEGMEQKAQAAAASQASMLAEAQDKLDKANEKGSPRAGREEKSEEEPEVKEKESLQETKDDASSQGDAPGIGSNVDIRL